MLRHNLVLKKLAVYSIVFIYLSAMSAIASAEEQSNNSLVKIITLRNLIENAYQMRDKTIHTGPLQCVDDPKGEFICAIAVGGSNLMITGLFLGSKTSEKDVDRLQHECTGTANFERPQCSFDIEIGLKTYRTTIMDFETGSKRVHFFTGGVIDFFKASK